MRIIVANRIMDYATQDKNFFLISGDSGFMVLDEYQRKFPKQFLNLGIAEQNTISFAAGLGLTGFKVFVYNIVPFVLYRCYEQVRNDICYQRLPVTLIGLGSGITYAPAGMTHYSIEDIALARTLPNLVILSPSDPMEAKGAVDFAIASNNPVYIRIAKSGEPVFHLGPIKDITKPQLLRDGSDVAVLFHGSISKEVMEAVDSTSQKPIIISVPMIQPLNFDVLKEMLQGVHAIITVEEHYIEGGLGSVIAEWIVRERQSFTLKKMGIKNEFIHAVKNIQGMRELHGISSGQIKEAIEESLKDA